MEAHIEREFKFDLDPDFEPPDLRPVVGRTERLPEQHLTTTYLDTADRRLWARGITLRHRVEAEGDAPVQGPGKWTMKLPEPAGGHDGVARSELSWTGPLDAVPPAAMSIVAGVVRKRELEPLVVLSTDRRRLLLHDDGTPWAEVDDDMATVASGGRQGLRFRQLEIELLGAEETGGGSQQLAAVLSELRRAGATPGGGSKLALAAGLEGPLSPRPPGRGDLDVRSFVTAILSVDLGLLLEADYRLRLPASAGGPDPFEAAAVRAATSAVEGLRADLRVLGAVLDPVWADHVRSDLRWVGARLERLAEEDLLVERVASHDERDGVVATVGRETMHELVGLLRSDRHRTAMDLSQALESDRYADMLDRLQAAAADPPLFDVAAGGRPEGSLEGVLRPVLGAYWRVLKTELETAHGSGGGEVDHLRSLAVRLAHAAAMAEPILGKRARRTAAAAFELQAVLGRLRRSMRAGRELAEIASHPAATSQLAFAAGVVAGRAEREVVHLRSAWPDAAKKVLKAGKSLRS